MLHERLAALYRGQVDVWGAVEGRQIKRPLTLEDWYEHCYGRGSVGVYPLLNLYGTWSVGWCGVDIDEGPDLIGIAANIWRALKHLGIASFVEKSKGKGFHNLCFIDGWVPATTARAAMQVACDVVGYRPKEIYPKQTELAEGQAGNYLNAAYSKKWADQGRRVMLNMEHYSRHPMKLESFLDKAEASLNSPDVIAKAAALWKPPPPPRPVYISRPASASEATRLRGSARCLYEDGPLPSQTTGRIDRSAALQRLAHLCRAQGDVTAGEAYEYVADLDARLLGKYVGRADAELQYQRIVTRAYS